MILGHIVDPPARLAGEPGTAVVSPSSLSGRWVFLSCFSQAHPRERSCCVMMRSCCDRSCAVPQRISPWCELLSIPSLASCFLWWPGSPVGTAHTVPNPNCAGKQLVGSAQASAAELPELVTVSTLKPALARVSWSRHLPKASFSVCTHLI